MFHVDSMIIAANCLYIIAVRNILWLIFDPLTLFRQYAHKCLC